MIERYRPLPKELRLGFSKIHDIGLFAKEKINRGKNLGISHIQIGKELFRTPLGGFINHKPVIKGEDASGELVELSGPNCEKVKQRADGAKIEWRLVTRQDIKAGEELTLEYTFYKI